MQPRRLKHIITINGTTEKMDADGDRYTVCNIKLRTKDVEHNVQRSWKNFKKFDLEWKKIYPAIKNEFNLPTTSRPVLDMMCNQLQQYLQGMCTVGCLEEFVLKFLGMDARLVKGGVAESPKDTRSSKPLVFDLHRLANCPDFAQKKGNNDKANRRAHMEKMKFLAKNRDLIARLMPGGEDSMLSDGALNGSMNANGITTKRADVSTDEGAEYLVTKPYKPEGEEGNSCVELTKGDVLKVIDTSNAEWWYGNFIKGGTDTEWNEGYFPAECVIRRVPKVQVPGELPEHLTEADTIAQMSVGVMFTKYPYTRSKVGPALREVYFRPNADASSPLGVLYWSHVGIRVPTAKHSIRISQISRVLVGKQTDTFRRFPQADGSRCLSIEFTNNNKLKSLNLQAGNSDTRDAWASALRSIMKGGGRRYQTPSSTKKSFYPNRQKDSVSVSSQSSLDSMSSLSDIASSVGSDAGSPKQSWGTGSGSFSSVLSIPPAIHRSESSPSTSSFTLASPRAPTLNSLAAPPKLSRGGSTPTPTPPPRPVEAREGREGVPAVKTAQPSLPPRRGAAQNAIALPPRGHPKSSRDSEQAEGPSQRVRSYSPDSNYASSENSFASGSRSRDSSAAPSEGEKNQNELNGFVQAQLKERMQQRSKGEPVQNGSTPGTLVVGSKGPPPLPVQQYKEERQPLDGIAAAVSSALRTMPQQQSSMSQQNPVVVIICNNPNDALRQIQANPQFRNSPYALQ